MFLFLSKYKFFDSTKFSFANITKKIKSTLDDYENINSYRNTLYGIFFNLPFYFTISYLLVVYLLQFTILIFNSRLKCNNGKIMNSNINRNTNTKRDILIPQHSVVAKNLINGYEFKVTNYNYKYIKEKFKCLNSKDSNLPETEDSMKNFKLFLKRTFNFSSRHYSNTYTVAFMIIYFLTFFVLSFINAFDDLIYKFFIMFDQYIYKIPDFIQEFSFYNQLLVGCFLSTIWIFIQIVSSMINFQNDLIYLRSGKKEWSQLLYKYDKKLYEEKLNSRNKKGVNVAQNSMHFSGYLIAHLVYGYIIIYCGFLIILLVSKIFYYYPNLFISLIEIIFPVIILFALKTSILQILIQFLFSKDYYRVKRSNVYNVLSFFNFFFDCFIGIITCFLRIGLSNLVSLFHFNRIDSSIYNEKNDFILKYNDKGYLAYKNYVLMEHWYNNPIVNGFCEMLIESMLNSKLNEEETNLNEKAIKNRKHLRNILFLCILMRNHKLKPVLEPHRKISILGSNENNTSTGHEQESNLTPESSIINVESNKAQLENSRISINTSYIN